MYALYRLHVRFIQASSMLNLRFIHAVTTAKSTVIWEVSHKVIHDWGNRTLKEITLGHRQSDRSPVRDMEYFMIPPQSLGWRSTLEFQLDALKRRHRIVDQILKFSLSVQVVF